MLEKNKCSRKQNFRKKKKIIHIKVPCLEPKISAHGEEALEGSEINIGHWQNSFTKISTTG